MMTIGLDTPAAMATEALTQYAAGFFLLKLKLGAAGDGDRLAAVRAAVPDARLVVDANAGWTLDALHALMPALVAARVELVEQPLPPHADAALAGQRWPMRLCADESCQTAADLQRLAGSFDMINIKLDKVGGLTAGLALASEARALGLGVMVGNMLGSSLAMAPAFLLAQVADYADLDGPTSFTRDASPAIVYRDGQVLPPDPRLWG
jgi:L-alanine-DL-glutamate epimerase-like enolase superfamily enzyme